MLLDVRVQAEPFAPLAEQGTLWLGQARIGALVSFIGLMRDFNEGNPVSRLTLEHYDQRAADFWEGTRAHDVSGSAV